ncbi:hypothetical protein K9N68_20620 [Kovacikia minuta CCNUW1]|uniref:hypothetical protein n=1 Tax=Kovacikia minuta TaxID=2931930 RepID=UPI001CCC5712|nr:hypothetical protein [Kovacikia minuta]UBF24118.1 hypothetical protein K9N68_20620 [Kovacikia minuta CCNUW1]
MKICCRCQKRFHSSSWICPACEYQPALIDGSPAFAPELAEGGDSYEVELFAQYFHLEARNFWFRARNRLIVWSLQRYFPQATSFLEIGCGSGFVLSGVEQAFPNLDVIRK